QAVDAGPTEPCPGLNGPHRRIIIGAHWRVSPTECRMQIAFLLFDGITPLDAIGPFDVLGKIPGAAPAFVGHEKRLYRTKGGTLGLQADYTLDEVPSPDVLLIPGGPGADATAEDGHVTEWVSRAHEHSTSWTTSVCTGALILGG